MIVNARVVLCPLIGLSVPQGISCLCYGAFPGLQVRFTPQSSTSLTESRSVSTSTSESLLSDFEVASLSIPGTDPDRPQKVNQDAYFTFDTPEMSGIGIFDGHGKKGHQVNEYLRLQLPMRIEEQINMDGEIPEDSKEIYEKFTNNMREFAHYDANYADNDSVRQYLENAFHLAHIDALECKGVPAGRSGTTCVVAAISKDNRLFTAIVGDSRGILANGDQTAQQLTEDTTTKLEDELKRVEQSDGRVDDLGNIFYGPIGIAMTRSLGNGLMLRAGVIPTPIIKAHGPLPLGSAVVLGTDGIFDVLTNEKVAEIISPSASLDKSITAICQRARDGWRGDLPIETKVDDITCIAMRRKR